MSPSLVERVRGLKQTWSWGGGQGFTQPQLWQSDIGLALGAPWSTPDREKIANDFTGYVEGAYRSNGIVFACALARQWVFAEARFQWQRLVDGRPGDLFDSPALDLLRAPEPNRTTGELLCQMDADVTAAGNFYACVVDDAGRYGRAATGPGRRIARMRPDWVTIIISSASGDPYALDARAIGFLYDPAASTVRPAVGADAVLLLPDEVVHHSPIPDPIARHRGMSWLTPVLREIRSDKAAMAHKEAFFANGAALQTVVTLDKDLNPDQFAAFVEKFKAAHRGPDKAYETVFLGGGADVTVVGTDLSKLDFKNVTGAGETRIAAAARVPPVIVGLSEGLAGSSLNAGNYASAKRSFVDATMRPLWRMAAGSLATILDVPAGAHLWYDDRDIPFLREDAQAAADILARESEIIRRLVDAGYDPDAAVAAVTSGDLRRLTGHHSGLFSVQLQPAGADQTPPAGGQ